MRVYVSSDVSKEYAATRAVQIELSTDRVLCQASHRVLEYWTDT